MYPKSERNNRVVSQDARASPSLDVTPSNLMRTNRRRVRFQEDVEFEELNERIRYLEIENARLEFENSELKYKFYKKSLDADENSDLVEIYNTNVRKREIGISEVDDNGEFVKIYNKSSKTVDISNWLIYSSSDKNECIYQFPKDTRIKGGATITIWSCDAISRIANNTNLVIQNSRWVAGNDIRTVLCDSNEEEIAGLEYAKKVISPFSDTTQDDSAIRSDGKSQKTWCSLM